MTRFHPLLATIIILLNVGTIVVGWGSLKTVEITSPDGSVIVVPPAITSDVLFIPVMFNITIPFLPTFLYQLTIVKRLVLGAGLVFLFVMVYQFVNTPSLIPRTIGNLPDGPIGYVLATLCPLFPIVWGEGYGAIFGGKRIPSASVVSTANDSPTISSSEIADTGPGNQSTPSQKSFDIVECPNCKRRVVPMTNGVCPSCKRSNLSHRST